MSGLSLLPAGIALSLVLAGVLLLCAGIAATRLSWFQSGPAALRADRLLTAIVAPWVLAVAFAACVIVTLVEDVVAFHRVPHLCLDPTFATSLGQLAVFSFETVSVLALLAVGWQIRGVVRLHRQFRRLTRLGGPALSPKTAAAIRQVEESLRTGFGGFREVDLPGANAFVVGVVRPRCVLARSLVERLSLEEVVAVIAHEAAHLRRRDPAARILVFACGRMFGFLPPVRALLHAWEEAAEVAADDIAVEATGCHLELAGALLAASSPTLSVAPALVSGSRALVVFRIERLLSPPVPHVGLAWRRRVHLLLAVAAVAGVFFASVNSPLLPSLHCFVENVASHGIHPR